MKMSRIALSLSSILFLGTGLSAGAREYRASNLYEARGPVKEIKLKSKNDFSKSRSKVSFLENGMQTWDQTYYDSMGLPRGIIVNMGNRILTDVKISYSEEGNPLVIIYHDKAGDAPSMTVEYNWEGDRLASMKVTERKAKGDKITLCEYSQEMTDANGNWISRLVHQTVTEGALSPKTEDFTESRTITYY